MKIKNFINDVSASVEQNLYDFKNCATALKHSGHYYKQDVIASILASEGSLQQMSLLLNRSRQSVKNYVYGNADILEFYVNYREGMIDEVERIHFREALNPGEGQAQRFILSTLAKDRGYSTRFEATGKNGGPITVKELSDDELQNIIGSG